jgi:hypothetical protein
MVQRDSSPRLCCHRERTVAFLARSRFSRFPEKRARQFSTPVLQSTFIELIFQLVTQIQPLNKLKRSILSYPCHTTIGGRNDAGKYSSNYVASSQNHHDAQFALPIMPCTPEITVQSLGTPVSVQHTCKPCLALFPPGYASHFAT